MKTYEVTLPIAGVAYLTIQAESEEEAVSKAMDEVVQTDIEEWSSYRRISSGNVLHVSHNEAYAEEIADEG